MVWTSRNINRWMLLLFFYVFVFVPKTFDKYSIIALFLLMLYFFCHPCLIVISLVNVSFSMLQLAHWNRTRATANTCTTHICESLCKTFTCSTELLISEHLTPHHSAISAANFFSLNKFQEAERFVLRKQSLCWPTLSLYCLFLGVIKLKIKVEQANGSAEWPA